MSTIDFDCQQYTTFTSQVCHMLKSISAENFVNFVSNLDLDEFLMKNKIKEVLYLVAITDMICNKNNLPLVKQFEKYRKMKLKELSYPEGLELYCSITNDQQAKQKMLQSAIPELLKYNIVENSICNIC